ncbi:MAG: PilZ domain-containing protein [Proteobacteria bacterium]|nr:PilZ domain-containing protein [Pseudomonadota bacterium]MBU1586076.1 PilZ domain-containing protein [Pseudomonadota bacterium]MBU2455321.1 PilZ domain-containing protein [Pseudomonadota bacterium]MBU2630291.1 PilZ domain-containing protein [Pseudomonadota bacterium]
MEDYSEKRLYERYDYQEPVSLHRYESQDQFYAAKMYNYSSGGMYLRTNEEMTVGQHVYVRLKNYYADSKGPEKYKNYSGYIRWSDELGTSVPSGQYGYGVEYTKPVYY